MRPSEASALQQADIVVWVGPDLTPWLERPIDGLGTDATVIELLDTEGTLVRASVAGYSHAHGESDQADAKAADAHDDGTAIDPHAWLNPDNAVAWLRAIARTLSEADPENASQYKANADATAAVIAVETGRIKAVFDKKDPLPAVVHHDAYGYFLNYFGLPPALAVSDTKATAPDSARLGRLREDIAGSGAQCIFADPRFSAEIINRLADDIGLEVQVLDALGSDIPPGAEHFVTLMRNMANSFASCG